MSELTAEFERLRQAGIQAYRDRDYSHAAEILDQAVDLDPQSAETWELLGTAQLRLNRYHDAIDSYSQAITNNPHLATAYLNLGAVYHRIGEFDRAVKFLQQGIQRDQRSVEGFFNLGLCYRRLDEFELANSAFKEVLRLNPQEWDAYYQLGKIARDQGKIDQEVAYYLKALEIEPDNQRVKKSLETARDRQRALEEERNPFGRLVQQETLRQTSATTILPSLNERERRIDRQNVRILAVAVREASEDYLKLLKGEGHYILEMVKSTLADGNFHSRSFQHVHHKYRETARNIASRRALLQQKMSEWQNHENEVLACMEQKTS